MTLIGGFPRCFFLTQEDDNTLVTTTDDRNEPLLVASTDAMMRNWSSTATTTTTRRRNSAINTLKYWGRNNQHAGTRQSTSDRNKDAAIRRYTTIVMSWAARATDRFERRWTQQYALIDDVDSWSPYVFASHVGWSATTTHSSHRWRGITGPWITINNRPRPVNREERTITTSTIARDVTINRGGHINQNQHVDLEGRLEEWCGSGKIIDGEGDCGWLIIGGAAIVGGGGNGCDTTTNMGVKQQSTTNMMWTASLVQSSTSFTKN